ncbi:hypothetical protein GCM10022259_38750 [Aquimarina mytili]
MVTTFSYAQFDFATETEPNNLTNDSGVQTLTVATTNTTTIFSGGTVVGSDEDYWKIGRSPFVLGSVGMGMQSNSGSMQPEVWLETRTGSYDGPLVSNTLIHPGTDQSNRAMTLTYTAANEYYLVRVGGGRSGGYSYRANFPRCNIPGLTTVLSTDRNENDFTINSVAGSTNISLIKVNTVNSFTDPSAGYTYPTATSATNVAYPGSGEQTVYTGNSTTPNVTISGLTANTTYYVKVFNYSDCGGNLKLNAGNVFTVTTCGAAPATATALNLAANNESSSYVSSFTGTTGASIRYVVKANTINTFTAPTNGTTLPTANAVYGGGEQVVYAGDSATPNELITGLTTGTEYFFKVYKAELCGGNYYFESTGVSSSITPVCSPPNSNAGIYLYAEPTNTHNTIRVVNFTGGNNADGKIIYMSDENNFTLPTTLTAASLPTASPDYTGKTGQVAAYIGAANGFGLMTTGLSPNTTYYYAAVNYKICNGVYYFYPTGIYSQQTTCGVTSTLASGAVINNVETTSLDLNSFTAPTATVNAPDGYVIKMNTVNSFSPLAIGATIPTGSTAYAGGEQVIYSGTSVTPLLNITGLSEGAQYFFTIYGYKDCNGTTIYQQTGYAFSQFALGLNFAPPVIRYNDPATTLSATTTSTGAIAYSLIGDTTGATLVGSDFTPGAVGSTTLRVTVPANGIYQTISKDYNLTISKANPVITWNAPASIVAGVPLDASYLNASANVAGSFEYYTFYSSFTNTFSGRITEGVTSLPYNSGFPTTIYTRFIPNDTNYNVAVGSTPITVTNSNTGIIEITAVDAIKALGSPDPALTSALTSGQLNQSEIIWVPLKREPGETEGTYVISIDETAQAPASFDPFGLCPTGVCIGTDPLGYGYIDIEDSFGRVTNGDYTIQLQTGTFTITTKEQVTITLDRFDLYNTFYNATPRRAVDISSIVLTSDGSPVSPTVNLSYSGTDVFGNSYGPSATPPTNAGNYMVRASVDAVDPNYFGSVTGNFSISQYQIAITPDSPQTKVYDGSPKTFEATATGLSGENIPLRISYQIGPYYSEAAPIEIGSYPVSVFSTGTGNHTVSYSGGNLVITDKTEVAITLNPTDLTQQYDGTQKPVTVSSIETSPGVAATPTPTVNITYEGINGTFYNKTTTAPTATGEYKVFAYVDTADANFFGSTSATLTIFEKEYVTFNFDSASLTYNATSQGVNITSITDSNDVVITPAPAYTISYSGTDNADVDYGPSTTPPTNAGDYTITVAIDAANPTYQGTDTYNFTINRRAIEVTADAKSKVYGDADPVFTYQITNGSLVGGDTFTGSLGRINGESVGTYTMNQGTLASGENYAITVVSNDLTITPRAIEVTADAKSKIYGVLDPLLTYQLTAGTLQFSDVLSGSLSRIAGENTGSYPIRQGTVSAGSNYDITFVSNDLTITPRAIEITADAKSKTYGDADPALTYQITSGTLAGSDVFTGNLSRVAGENVGSYAIEQGTLTAGSNYTTTFISDDLTIGQRAIEIAADALNKQYGDADPALTYQITSGSLAGSDAFTGSLNRAAGEAVGPYAIGQGTIALNGNYALSFVPNTLTIGQRTIEITADAKSKVYGDTDPVLTYQITSGSLAGSDAFTGSLSRVAGEAVGPYVIDQGTVALNANYALSFVPNTLTIAQRAIEITADAQSKTYGDADPAFTYQITSGTLAGSDTIIGILERTAGENVGTYAIDQGTLGINPNYAISFVSNDLEITTRAIEVTAEAKTKIYGDADPALTYQITAGALQFSDAFTGALYRVAGQARGNYAINQGTLSLGANYNLTFVPGNLYIDYRFIRVIPAAPISKTYGDTDPALTWPYIITQGSLAYDDTLETYGTFRASGENIGRYQIRGLSARFTSTNGGESSYSITYTNAGSVSLDITARAIEVTADVQAKTYGDTDPTLSYQITNGALQFSDTFTGALSRATGENVGTYAINQGTLSAGRNYVVTYVSNDLTISQRPIEITADDLVKVIGSADPALTYQITSGGLQFSDVVTGSLSRVAGEALGNYAINQGTVSLNGNYNLTFVPGNLTITNLIPQVITFGSLADRTFGDTDFMLTATGGASGNPVTFVSSNTAVATISGNTVTIVGAGSTTITASQAGNATYAAATDVMQTLVVNKADQTITFTPLATVTEDDADFNLNATASSGLVVTYISSDPSVATVSGNTVSIIGLGTTTITASQAGDTNWNAATDVMQTLTVVEACPLVNLPANNFQIQTSSETCDGKNNGIITINTVETLNYTATINNQAYAFSSTLVVPDLSPGDYNVCITVDGFSSCEQCFELAIDQAPVLSGKTTIHDTSINTQVLVEIESGTAPYTVTINNEVVGEYTTNSFLVDVNNGDILDVHSSVTCQGKLSTTIGTLGTISAYPNPTRGNVTLLLPGTTENAIAIDIYNAIGMKVSSGIYSVVGNKVTLPMENVTAGVYFASIKASTSKIIKIIKE